MQGDYDGDDADDVGDGGLEADQLHDPHRGLVRHGVDLRDTSRCILIFKKIMMQHVSVNRCLT